MLSLASDYANIQLDLTVAAMLLAAAIVIAVVILLRKRTARQGQPPSQ